MVHQSNAAFVDAKGASVCQFERNKHNSRVNPPWKRSNTIVFFQIFDDLWWSLQTSCWFEVWISFDALRKSGCWFRCFWKPVSKPVVCSHGKLRFYLVLSWDHGQNRLPAFGLWCKKTVQATKYGSNTLEYSRRLKVATADRFQIGIFWSRHCARQTVFKCSEDCYFHACQDWMLGLDRAGKELFSASHHGATPGVRAEGRGWRPRQMGFFFRASFGVERSNLENWNQLGTRETLNPPKSSIPYAKVASLWFSR